MNRFSSLIAEHDPMVELGTWLPMPDSAIAQEVLFRYKDELIYLARERDTGDFRRLDWLEMVREVWNRHHPNQLGTPGTSWP